MRAKTINESDFTRDGKLPMGIETEEGLEAIQKSLQEYFDIGRVYILWNTDTDRKEVKKILEDKEKIKEAIELIKAAGVPKDRIEISHWDSIQLRRMPAVSKGNYSMFTCLTDKDQDIIMDFLNRFVPTGSTVEYEAWRRTEGETYVYWRELKDWRTGKSHPDPLSLLKNIKENRAKYKSTFNAG